MKVAENTLHSRQQQQQQQPSAAAATAALSNAIKRMSPEVAPIDDDMDKILMMPVRYCRKEPVFDLSNANTSNNQKRIVSVYILVQYNMTNLEGEAHRRGRHQLPDATDLLVTQMAQDNNEIKKSLDENGPVHMSTVRPRLPPAAAHKLPEGDELSSWLLYDVTSLLGDYTNKKIQIRNENFDILSSVIMIYMDDNKVGFRFRLLCMFLTRVSSLLFAVDAIEAQCRVHGSNFVLLSSALLCQLHCYG